SSFMGLGLVGSIIGTSPLAAAAEYWGWRAVMIGFAVVTLACALLIYLFVKEPPREQAPSTDGFIRGYVELLRTRSILFIIPMALVITIASQTIRGLWMGP